VDNKIIDNQSIVQIAIVVKDIEKSSKDYADFFGVEKPEWFVTEGYDKTEAEFMGEPTETRIKIANFNAGAISLELIEPDNNPSTWKYFLDTQGEGIHHIAFIVKNMKKKIELMGNTNMPLLQKGEFEGGRYAYFDTFEKLKVIIEMLEVD